jgi:hypothetical protein
MKKHIMTIAMAAAMLPAFAMAADVSGIWVRDAKSDPMPDTMYWAVRAPPAAPGNPNQEFVLTVKQDPATLVVTSPNRRLRSVALDGRPHETLTDTGIQKATVTAVNQPDALVITTTQPFGGMPGNAKLTVQETWALSPDGKALTITTSRALPARTAIDRQIYNRR